MNNFISFSEKNNIAFLQNEPLAKHSTFRIGKNALLAIFPDTTEKIIDTVRFFKESGEKFLVLGKGSNVLFPDYDIEYPIIFTERAAAIEKTGENIVKIGTFNSIAKNILPEIVAAFKIRYPEYGVNILVGDDLLNDLSTEKIDLFFGEEAIKGSYEFIPIKPDPYVAVFPKNANVKGRTIKKENLYEYPSIITTDGVYATYFDKPLKNGTVITSDDYTSVLSMVEKGVGYALIPQISLSGKSKRFLTLKLDPPVMRTLGVIYDRRAVKKAAAEKFVAFVKKLSV